MGSAASGSLFILGVNWYNARQVEFGFQEHVPHKVTLT